MRMNGRIIQDMGILHEISERYIMGIYHGIIKWQDFGIFDMGMYLIHTYDGK